MNVAIGMLLDQLGQARQIRSRVVPDRQRGFDVELQHHVWATPATEVREYQPARIPVNIGHDRGTVVGKVVHLHRDRWHRLWAVSELPGDPVEPDRMPTLYFSVETDHKRDGTDVIVRGVALVEATAQVGTRPIKILPGSVRDNRASRQLSELEREIMTTAHETVRLRKDDRAPTVVYDHWDAKLIGSSADNPAAWQRIDEQRAAIAKTVEIEHRPARILRVS